MELSAKRAQWQGREGGGVAGLMGHTTTNKVQGGRGGKKEVRATRKAEENVRHKT